MALANAYAAVIAGAEEKGAHADFAKKLLAYMKSRGHLSLLPQVLRILKREPAKKSVPVVTLAKESDARKFSHSIREVLAQLSAEEKHATVIDPRAVGGYSVRAGSRMVDKTFRSALISLYKEAIRS